MISFTDGPAKIDFVLLKLKCLRGQPPVYFYAKSTGGDQGTRAFMVNLYNTKLLNDTLTVSVFSDANAVKNME